MNEPRSTAMANGDLTASQSVGQPVKQPVTTTTATLTVTANAARAVFVVAVADRRSTLEMEMRFVAYNGKAACHSSNNSSNNNY